MEFKVRFILKMAEKNRFWYLQSLGYGGDG